MQTCVPNFLLLLFIGDKQPPQACADGERRTPSLRAKFNFKNSVEGEYSMIKNHMGNNTLFNFVRSG